MSDHHDNYAMCVIGNLVNDAVVADSHPPRISPRKLLAAIWTRHLAKTLQHGKHTLLLIGRQLFENLLC